jgi:hypothetical protein
MYKLDHCPRSWTEMHARNENYSACARWAELASRNRKERIAWAYESQNYEKLATTMHSWQGHVCRGSRIANNTA